MNNAPLMAYESVMVISNHKDGKGKDVEIEFMGASPCSSIEVCALNTEFMLRVTIDGKLVMLIPASVLDLDARKDIYRAFGVESNYMVGFVGKIP